MSGNSVSGIIQTVVAIILIALGDHTLAAAFIVSSAIWLTAK